MYKTEYWHMSRGYFSIVFKFSALKLLTLLLLDNLIISLKGQEVEVGSVTDQPTVYLSNLKV